MAVGVSIATLFLRGFKFKDLKAHFTDENIVIPAVDIWLVQSQPYPEKMQAYKAGVIGSTHGQGLYVICEDNQWYWVAGAYMTQAEADHAIEQEDILIGATSKLYNIEEKNLKITPDAVTPARQIFETVASVVDLLFKLRSNVIENVQDNNLILELTNKYNLLKSSADKLQELNAAIKSDLISSIIYTANVNILSLQDLVCGNNQIDLSVINTALLKTIFSVDNF